MRILYVGPDAEVTEYDEEVSDCAAGLAIMRDRIPCENLTVWNVTRSIRMWHDREATARCLAVNGPAIAIANDLGVEPLSVVRGAVFFTGPQDEKVGRFTSLPEELSRHFIDLIRD